MITICKRSTHLNQLSKKYKPPFLFHWFLNLFPICFWFVITVWYLIDTCYCCTFFFYGWKTKHVCWVSPVGSWETLITLYCLSNDALSLWMASFYASFQMAPNISDLGDFSFLLKKTVKWPGWVYFRTCIPTNRKIISQCNQYIKLLFFSNAISFWGLAVVNLQFTNYSNYVPAPLWRKSARGWIYLPTHALHSALILIRLVESSALNRE